VIDNSLAPSRLVNAGALNEELKFYSRRPRLKSVRPGQARHFAAHTQGLFRVIRVGGSRARQRRMSRSALIADMVVRGTRRGADMRTKRARHVRAAIRSLGRA
jgi:hypothetical protein